MKNIIIVLSVTLLWFGGCKPSHHKIKNKDPFYAKDGLLDLISIPLIKPYKLIKDRDTAWSLELQTTSLSTLAIDNVQGLDTVAGKILIYSKGGTEVKNIQYDELWFIIDPDSLQERSYNSLEAFNKALIKENVSHVNFIKPDTFYKKFRK